MEQPKTDVDAESEADAAADDDADGHVWTAALHTFTAAPCVVFAKPFDAATITHRPEKHSSPGARPER